MNERTNERTNEPHPVQYLQYLLLATCPRRYQIDMEGSLYKLIYSISNLIHGSLYTDHHLYVFTYLLLVILVTSPQTTLAGRQAGGRQAVVLRLYNRYTQCSSPCNLRVLSTVLYIAFLQALENFENPHLTIIPCPSLFVQSEIAPYRSS